MGSSFAQSTNCYPDTTLEWFGISMYPNAPKANFFSKKIAIEGIEIYSNIYRAMTVFGDTINHIKSKTIYDEDVPDSQIDKWLHEYYFNGVKVTTYGNEILSVVCCNPKYKTPDGFFVGQSIDEIINKYPEISISKDSGTFGISLYAHEGLEILFIDR